MTTLNEYQAKALTTALPNALKLDYLVPGIGGESGEVQEVLNQSYPTAHAYRQALISELGDVYWFAALIAHNRGWTLEEVVLDAEYEDLVDYQDAVNTVSANDFGAWNPVSLAFDLGTHVGNLQSAYAKAVRDDDGVFTDERLAKFRIALSNTFFYVALLARTIDADIATLTEKNIAKLFDRKDRGVLGGSGNNR